MPSAGLVLLSPSASWLLASKEVSQPKGFIATDAARVAAMNAFAQDFPGPRISSVGIDEVVFAFEAVHLLGQSMLLAVDKLSRLNWPDRREALRRLGQAGPMGISYLLVLQSALDALPNVDTALRAAWMATKIASGSRTVEAGDVSQWLSLSNALLALREIEAAEVFQCLGVVPESLEGLLSMVTADIDEELLKLSPAQFAAVLIGRPQWFRNLMDTVKNFDRSRTDFKEFLRPGKQWYGYYIGVAIHAEIGAWYKGQHAHAIGTPGEGVWTNSSPVESVFNALANYYKTSGLPTSSVGRAWALSRPDIYELSVIHNPPGLVYEIKPAGPTGEGLVDAAREAFRYALLLNAWDMPAVLGPAGAAGTVGNIPAPGGWVCFVSPVPGAIVYRYIKAPDESYRRKFPVTADERQQRTAELRARLQYQAPVSYPNAQQFPAELLLATAAILLIVLTRGRAAPVAAPIAETGGLTGLRWLLGPTLALP